MSTCKGCTLIRQWRRQWISVVYLAERWKDTSPFETHRAGGVNARPLHGDGDAVEEDNDQYNVVKQLVGDDLVAQGPKPDKECRGNVKFRWKENELGYPYKITMMTQIRRVTVWSRDLKFWMISFFFDICRKELLELPDFPHFLFFLLAVDAFPVHLQLKRSAK